MNASQRKLAAILRTLGVSPSARRPSWAQKPPACETLEGRQLLTAIPGFPSGMGQGMGQGMAMPMNPGGMADVSTVGMTGSQGMNARDFTSISPAGFPGGGGFEVHSFGGGGMVDPTGSGSTGFGGRLDSSDFAGGSSPWASTTSFDPSSTDFSPSGGPTATSPGTMGGSTADDTQLQTDFAKLQIDAQAIHDKSQVTPAMEAKVRADIKAIKGAMTTTPDQAAVTALETDMKTAQANPGGPTDAQLTQVQADQDAVYKSQGVNPELIGLLDADIQAIKTASGITSDDQATLAQDRQAIEADLAKLAPPTTLADPSASASASASDSASAVTAESLPASPPPATLTPAATTTDLTATATPLAATATTANATPRTLPTVALPPAATTPGAVTPTPSNRGHRGHGGHGGPVGHGARSGHFRRG